MTAALRSKSARTADRREPGRQFPAARVARDPPADSMTAGASDSVRCGRKSRYASPIAPCRSFAEPRSSPKPSRRRLARSSKRTRIPGGKSPIDQYTKCCLGSKTCLVCGLAFAFDFDLLFGFGPTLVPAVRREAPDAAEDWDAERSRGGIAWTAEDWDLGAGAGSNPRTSAVRRLGRIWSHALGQEYIKKQKS